MTIDDDDRRGETDGPETYEDAAEIFAAVEGRAPEDDDMITVTAAWTQRGWDHHDHLIDDSRMTEIVGQKFASVDDAMRAARARADHRGFVAIEYVAADGSCWLRGDEPSLPGRPPLCRRTDGPRAARRRRWR